MAKRGILILMVLFVMTSGSLPLKVLSHPARPNGGVAMRGSPVPNIAQVTRMELRAVPKEYRGPCPKVIRFIGEITFDGPGKMVYNIERSDGAKLAHGRDLSFAGAGTKRVDDTWEIGKSLEGWEMLASGDQRSNKAEFRVECTK
ncbi:MAG: hypothetical protein ABSA41_08855 [Terriglobia bacterium]|jgi:hypothetical protein